MNRMVVMVGDSVTEGNFRTIEALLMQKYTDEVEYVSNPTCGTEHRTYESPRDFDATHRGRWAPQYCVVVRRKNIFICMITARLGLMKVALSASAVYDFLTGSKVRPVGLTKDDVFIMNNALAYRSSFRLRKPVLELAKMYNSERGHKHKSSPTIAWRETSPQSFPEGSHLKHTKGACCYEPGYHPGNQWAKQAETEFSALKLKIPVLRTYHASSKLEGEDRPWACTRPPASPPKGQCPECRKNHFNFPPGFNLSDPFSRRALDAFDPFSDSPRCYSGDGTHYITSGPTAYHWFRVIAHFLRDLPRPDRTRNLPATFDAFQRVLRTCDLDRLGWNEAGRLEKEQRKRPNTTTHNASSGNWSKLSL
ncbi:hypothetical protein DIPPA_10425 [Diplonema papillatum]|nr:hypothetical protein DIPPA_10425 [Diplonema papillatum]